MGNTFITEEVLMKKVKIGNMKLRSYQAVFSFVLLALSGCGKDTNILALLTPNSDREAFDATYANARALYDNKELVEAEKYAAKAHKLDQKSQKAALLLGFIYLGRAGVGPFQLVGKMLANGESESKKTSLVAEDGGGGSSPLGGLTEVVGLTENEFSLMGELDESDKELPVIVPKCAGEARESVEKLSFVNKAIAVACPYVDPGAQLNNDSRHFCDLTEAKNINRASAHFLWAFSHLTEALAFYSVLTYSTGADTSKTNLEKRVAKLQSISVTDPSQLGSFLDQVSSLENTVSKVMPVTGECSKEYPQTQLVGLVNDMLSVNLAFARMAGVPKSITDSITKSMEKIEKIRSSSSGGGG
jgi:hypothetical protein